ncbi:hypothetical protein ACWDFL_00125 [Streptomyces bungoensis]
MTGIQYFWRHPLAEQVREEGREEGRLLNRREMVLRILEWQSVPVPDTVREQVNDCTDLDRLEVWIRRAMHAKDAAELFLEG